MALSFAPGTVSREPMSANTAAERAASVVPSRPARGSRSAPRRRSAAGPPTTGPISAGLVSLLSKSHGSGRSTARGSPGGRRGRSARRRGGRPGPRCARRRPARARRRRCESALRQQLRSRCSPAGGRRRRRGAAAAERAPRSPWPRRAARPAAAPRRRPGRAATSTCHGRPRPRSGLGAEIAEPRHQPLGRLALPRPRPTDGGSRTASRAGPAATPSRCGAVRSRRVAAVAMGRETYRLIPNMDSCPPARDPFHVRGIRIGVDYSWFFVLFLVILWLSGFYRDVLDTRRRRRALLLAGRARCCSSPRSCSTSSATHSSRAPRDRDLRHHAVDVRRRRADDPGLRLARHRVQDRDRGAAGDAGDRARLRRARDRAAGATSSTR